MKLERKFLKGQPKPNKNTTDNNKDKDNHYAISSYACTQNKNKKKILPFFIVRVLVRVRAPVHISDVGCIRFV